MKVYQNQIILEEKSRGFHLVTKEIESKAEALAMVSAGLAHLFLLHTSASICINENADPSVREDLKTHFDKLAPEQADHYTHTSEGPDDMPAHIKSTLIGCSLTVPIRNGAFALGTWQGIYLCEHRNRGGARKIIVTVTGE